MHEIQKDGDQNKKTWVKFYLQYWDKKGMCKQSWIQMVLFLSQDNFIRLNNLKTDYELFIYPLNIFPWDHFKNV